MSSFQNTNQSNENDDNIKLKNYIESWLLLNNEIKENNNRLNILNKNKKTIEKKIIKYSNLQEYDTKFKQKINLTNGDKIILYNNKVNKSISLKYLKSLFNEYFLLNKHIDYLNESQCQPEKNNLYNYIIKKRHYYNRLMITKDKKL